MTARPSVKVSVSGGEDIRRRLRQLSQQYPEAFAAGLYRVGVAILSTALPLTPVEFATLRASGYVSPPQGEAKDATVEIGYGTKYAVAQHERTDYRHPRGGQAKYLQAAVDIIAGQAVAIAGEFMERNPDAKFAAQGGIPTSPREGMKEHRQRRSQARRLARGAALARKRAGQ